MDVSYTDKWPRTKRLEIPTKLNFRSHIIRVILGITSYKVVANVSGYCTTDRNDIFPMASCTQSL